MTDRQRAQTYLQKALNNPSAEFRDGQWESIDRLLHGKRALVVQRTGWGKSMVYFIAARLLRDRGSGPALLISPLLSLMRNQLEAAAGIGIAARTINSGNRSEWQPIEEELRQDRVDVLLISPERLANDEFRQTVLAQTAANIGLLVVDEAHCISDWGHDFRPDYRRIARVIQAVPANVPILATTATANDRVVGDIKSQLGEEIVLQRGTLVRKSLKLQNITMPGMTSRMAWLVQTIPELPGSGIVYVLTQRDAARLAEWLRLNHIDAQAYHADIGDPENGAAEKEELEQRLLRNEIKVLVATVALGMGFDKPDLGFVIHFQRPASVVHYYQQVGRAGRAVEEAYGILLGGEEDDPIADYFIANAFPPQQHIRKVLDALGQQDGGLTLQELQRQVNLKQTHLEKTLKFLTVESPSPVLKLASKWHVTAAASAYRVDQRHVDARLANEAGIFLRRNYQPIPPRKKWPQKNTFSHYPFRGGGIPENQQACEGRALSLRGDAGWGQLVRDGKWDDLVAACVEMLERCPPAPAPRWVTSVPSRKQPEPVADFAAKLAGALGLPFVPCVLQTRDHEPQRNMANSYQQAKNLDGVFEVGASCPAEACLLVDDVVDSRWTLTVISALLRHAGCAAVHPLALASNSPRMD